GLTIKVAKHGQANDSLLLRTVRWPGLWLRPAQLPQGWETMGRATILPLAGRWGARAELPPLATPGGERASRNLGGGGGCGEREPYSSFGAGGDRGRHPARAGRSGQPR